MKNSDPALIAVRRTNVRIPATAAHRPESISFDRYPIDLIVSPPDAAGGQGIRIKPQETH
jgi:hypothetical protein